MSRFVDVEDQRTDGRTNGRTIFWVVGSTDVENCNVLSDLAHLLDLTKLDFKFFNNLKKLKNPKFCERSHSTNLTNSINVINIAIIIKILQNLKILKNLKISFFGQK